MSLPLIGAGPGVAGAGGVWSPLTSPAGVTLAGWYENDAATIYHDLGSTLATNGQGIQQINDKSTLNNHINDASNGSSLFPTWDTTGTGRITFDGDDTLLSGTKTWTDGSGQLSASWAGSVADVSGTQFLLSLSGSSNVLRLFVSGGVLSATVYDNGGTGTTATGPTVTNNTDFRVTVTASSTFLTVYGNGVPGTPIALTGTRNSSNTELYMGSLTGSFRLIAGSKMAVAALWRGVLGAGDLTSDDTYMTGRL